MDILEQLKYEKDNNKLQLLIEKEIESIYLEYTNDITSIYGSIKNFDESKVFSFADFPVANKRFNKLLLTINSRVRTSIEKGISSAWELANNKGDELVKDVFKGRLDSSLIPKSYNSQNLEALKAFQERKVNGMNLSNRVWKYTQQYKEEIELQFDIALLNGTSANDLAKDLKQHLQNPDNLFRRVKNARGNLVLSKKAKLFNAGRGVYRSSYKNALRLARTEINMSYREADFQRNLNLDFVVGFEVRRSNNKYSCDLCKALAVKYPKTFKFRGWHPNCRCYCVTILATEAEIDKMTEQILKGEKINVPSKNEVKKLPKSFNDYIKENKNKLLAMANIPYFVTDNSSLINMKPSK